MAYITYAAANAIIAAEGGTALPSNAQLLEKATNRIEVLRFNRDAEKKFRPRYLDGREPNLDGSASATKPKIPFELAWATTKLAEWYRDNPNELYKSREGEHLSKQLSDLPLAIQSALWPFLHASVKVDIGDTTRSIDIAEAPDAPKAGGLGRAGTPVPADNTAPAPVPVPAQTRVKGGAIYLDAATDRAYIKLGANVNPDTIDPAVAASFDRVIDLAEISDGNDW